ncbi:MAG: hypothetical protein ACE1Y4_03055, partial [Lysobacterales bacterium]
ASHLDWRGHLKFPTQPSQRGGSRTPPVIAVTDKNLQVSTIATGNAPWVGQHILEAVCMPLLAHPYPFQPTVALA